MTDITLDTLPDAADLFLASAVHDHDRVTVRVEYPTFSRRGVRRRALAVSLGADGSLTASSGGIPEPSMTQDTLLDPCQVLGRVPGHALSMVYADMACEAAVAGAGGYRACGRGPWDLRPVIAEAVQARIDHAYGLGMGRRMPARTLEALEAVGAVATHGRPGLVERIRTAADPSLPIAFLARNPVMGVAVLAREPGWLAMVEGRPDLDAFLAAKADVEALPATTLASGRPMRIGAMGAEGALAEWDVALWRRAEGFRPEGVQAEEFATLLPRLPIEWLPAPGEAQALMRVDDTRRRLSGGAPFADAAPGAVLKGSKGRWREYDARLAGILGDRGDALSGKRAYGSPGTMDRLVMAFVRDVAAPVALAFPDLAPGLRAHVASGMRSEHPRILNDPSRVIHPVGRLLLAGMDLPSRCHVLVAHAEALPAIVGAAGRHGWTGGAGIGPVEVVPAIQAIDREHGVSVEVLAVSRTWLRGPRDRDATLSVLAPYRVRRAEIPFEDGSIVVVVVMPASTFEGALDVKLRVLSRGPVDPVSILVDALRCATDGVGDAILARAGLTASFTAPPPAGSGTAWHPSIALGEDAMADMLKAWRHVLPHRLRRLVPRDLAIALQAGFVKET